MSSSPPTLFEKLCRPSNEPGIPPFFPVPLQQYALSGAETNRDLTRIEWEMWKNNAGLSYAMSRHAEGYFADKHVPVILSAPFLAWLNEETVRTENLPVTRFMELMCRHMVPYDRLWDVRKKRGIGRLYADLAGTLGLALQLPAELLPKALFDYLAEPMPGIAETGGMPLSRGLAYVWRTLLPQVPFMPAHGPARSEFLVQFFRLYGIMGLDGRFATPALAEWLNAPLYPIGRGEASLTRLIVEILRLAGIEESRFEDSAFALHAFRQFFSDIYHTLSLPPAVAEAHERLAAATQLAIKPAPSPAKSPVRYITEAVRPLPIDPAVDVNLIGWDDQTRQMGMRGRCLKDMLAATGLRYVQVPSFSEAQQLGKASPPRASVNLFACALEHLSDFMLRQGLELFEGRYNIGYCTWETSRLSRSQRAAVHLLDEIWVPSQAQKALFEKEASCPVRVVPLPVNAPAPAPFISRAALELPSDVFLFMTSFDCFDWIARKNPLTLIRAFQQAFPGGEKVALAIKTRNVAQAASLKEDGNLFRLNQAWADPRIHVFHDEFSGAEMNGFLNLADAYVSMHRSSVFGAAMAEAMALGKPVIATEGQGPADYLSEKTGFPLKSVPCEIVYDAYRYLDKEIGHRWADPETDSAVAAMRAVFADPAGARQRAAEGQRLVQSRYSLKSAAAAMESRLREILQQQAAARAA